MRLRILIMIVCFASHLSCMPSSPALAAPFQDCGNGTVADTRSNLIWLKNAECFFPGDIFSGSNTFVNGLASGACGLTDGSQAGDWHLPTIEELQSLICGPGLPAWQINGCDFISDVYNPNGAQPYLWLNTQGFTNVEGLTLVNTYWSSSLAPLPGTDPTFIYWTLSMNNGGAFHVDKRDGSLVWPVRGGQCGSILPTPPILSVFILGNGQGSVHSNPPGLECANSPPAGCSSGFSGSPFVCLTATPDWKSLFNNWSGDCTVLLPCLCSVPMDAPHKSVFVTFDPILKAKLEPETTLFSSLQDAYGAAANGSAIKAQVYTFMENLLMDSPITVTLDGGLDTSYNITIDYTTLQGILTVQQGTLNVNNLIINSICQPGFINCSGACRDFQNDPTNCGACGNVCPVGHSCINGGC